MGVDWKLAGATAAILISGWMGFLLGVLWRGLARRTYY